MFPEKVLLFELDNLTPWSEDDPPIMVFIEKVLFAHEDKTTPSLEELVILFPIKVLLLLELTDK